MNKLPLIGLTAWTAAAPLLLGGCVLSSTERKIRVAQHAERPARRVKALRAMAKRPVPRMRKPLEGVLATDIDPAARALAADALGKLGMEESAEQLRLSAGRDTAWVVRRRSLRALAEVMGAEAAADLERALKGDPRPAVRVVAVELIDAVVPPGQRGALLVSALRDQSTSVRVLAHRYLRALTGEQIPPGDIERWQQAVGEGGG